MNQEKIVQAAVDYSNLLLEEYPPAATEGHAVVVPATPQHNTAFVVTLTPVEMIPDQGPQPQPLLAAEEMLLHRPNTPVTGGGFDS